MSLAWAPREIRRDLPPEFWGVYNYIAVQWYGSEHGKAEMKDRWYHRGMIFLECFADGWEVKRSLDYQQSSQSIRRQQQ